MSSIWDGIPDATEVDLTQLTEEQRKQLLSEYIDEQKAADLVTQIDGSASGEGRDERPGQDRWQRIWRGKRRKTGTRRRTAPLAREETIDRDKSAQI